jgi:hypothetical protein
MYSSHAATSLCKDATLELRVKTVKYFKGIMKVFKIIHSIRSNEIFLMADSHVEGAHGAAAPGSVEPHHDAPPRAHAEPLGHAPFNPRGWSRVVGIVAVAACCTWALFCGPMNWFVVPFFSIIKLSRIPHVTRCKELPIIIFK